MTSAQWWGLWTVMVVLFAATVLHTVRCTDEVKAETAASEARIIKALEDMR